MDSIFWKKLGAEAKIARADLWKTLLECQKALGEEIPDAADEIGNAYIDLRLSYMDARSLLIQGIAPGEEMLDPPVDEDNEMPSSFKQEVLLFMDMAELHAEEADGDMSVTEAGKHMLKEGNLRHPYL